MTLFILHSSFATLHPCKSPDFFQGTMRRFVGFIHRDCLSCAHVWTTLPCPSTPWEMGNPLAAKVALTLAKIIHALGGNSSLVTARYIIVRFSVTCQDLRMAGTVKDSGLISQVSRALVASYGDFPPWLCIKRHSLPDGLQSKGWVTSRPAFITSYFSTITSSVDTPLHRQKCLKNR